MGIHVAEIEWAQAVLSSRTKPASYCLIIRVLFLLGWSQDNIDISEGFAQNGLGMNMVMGVLKLLVLCIRF